MEDYKKLLEKAYDEVKVVGAMGERFEIPKIEGFFEGKRTILTNFLQIATYLRRDPEHLQRFLSKELATQIIKDNERLVLNAKISSKKINPKIEEYVREFVLCKECNKPDTELIKEGKFTVLHCLACGAKHPIRTKI
jgi:translation initiation factor 2 subunit 2